MRIRLKKTYLLEVLPYLFVFLATLYQPWDSDLGWHLKYGEYFFQHFSILRENIYSTEMAGYLWPNTNWLTDVLTYSVFYAGGFLGLSIASALIITLAFWTFSKAFDLDFYQKAIIFPILILLEEPVNKISFRGQLISILFLGLLFLFLEKLSDKKKLWVIPLLFIIWVNTHGQFILGIGIFGLYIGFKVIEKVFSYESFSVGSFLKALNEYRLLNISFLLSVIAGVINPFGIATYQIALSHFGSKELQFIMEYLPVDELSDEWWKQMIYGILLFFGILGIIFKEDFKKNISKIGIVSIFYLLSFMVKRYAWSMYYLGIPLLKPVGNFLKPDSEKNAVRAGVIMFLLFISFTVYLKLPLDQFWKMDWQTYAREYNSISEGAIKYVADNNLGQNMMSKYDWGGYIIWNHPEIKPSIDGRMTVWHDPVSGYSPLAEYYAYETNERDIDDSKYDVVLMGKDKEVYKRLEELVKEGKWEKRYEDEFGGVFIKLRN